MSNANTKPQARVQQMRLLALFEGLFYAGPIDCKATERTCDAMTVTTVREHPDISHHKVAHYNNDDS
jgi:hypothetical protein